MKGPLDVVLTTLTGMFLSEQVMEPFVQTLKECKKALSKEK
jgi:flagellar motor component MotA